MKIFDLKQTSSDHIQIFRDLTNKQLRTQRFKGCRIVVVESEIAMRVAIQEGLKPYAFLLSQGKFKALQDVLVGFEDCEVFLMDDDYASSLTGFAVTRGALGAFLLNEEITLESMLNDSQKLVVLDGITDVANIGAIIRNAAGLGADGVVLTNTCCDPYHRRSIRVSMGTIFQIPVLRINDVQSRTIIQTLREHKFNCAGLCLDSTAIDLNSFSYSSQEKLVLFFGSEGSGLSSEILKNLDTKIVVPMHHGVDSLNVSVCTGIVLWHLFNA